MSTAATRQADMTPELLFDLLRTRRSVRRFRPEPVARGVVTALLEAAVLAPSASNKQPWRFLVVESGHTIAQMATSVREATARIAAHVPSENQEAFLAYGDYFTRFELASTVIVPIHRALSVLTNLVDAELAAIDRAAVREMEEQSGLIGTALALENMLLMAHAMGLGASGMTGPLVAEPALRAILEVPPGWGIVALVPVGYPDEEPRPTDRKPVDKVVRWL
jgi:nitroreductase